MKALTSLVVFDLSVTLLLLAAFACGPTEPPTEAGAVLHDVRQLGADSVAARMDRDDNFGKRVLDGIASGDSTWLQVAVELRETGNASLAEDLPVYVAEALPKAPERVLALVEQKRFSVGAVCSIPFVEPSDSQVAAYYARATSALGRVTDESVAAERDRCRAELDAARRAGPNRG